MAATPAFQQRYQTRSSSPQQAPKEEKNPFEGLTDEQIRAIAEGKMQAAPSTGTSTAGGSGLDMASLAELLGGGEEDTSVDMRELDIRESENNTELMLQILAMMQEQEGQVPAGPEMMDPPDPLLDLLLKAYTPQQSGAPYLQDPMTGQVSRGPSLFQGPSPESYVNAFDQIMAKLMIPAPAAPAKRGLLEMLQEASDMGSMINGGPRRAFTPETQAPIEEAAAIGSGMRDKLRDLLAGIFPSGGVTAPESPLNSFMPGAGGIGGVAPPPNIANLPSSSIPFRR